MKVPESPSGCLARSPERSLLWDSSALRPRATLLRAIRIRMIVSSTLSTIQRGSTPARRPGRFESTLHGLAAVLQQGLPPFRVRAVPKGSSMIPPRTGEDRVHQRPGVDSREGGPRRGRALIPEPGGTNDFPGLKHNHDRPCEGQQYVASGRPSHGRSWLCSDPGSRHSSRVLGSGHAPEAVLPRENRRRAAGGRGPRPCVAGWSGKLLEPRKP